LLGQTVGYYRITEKIADGGMGEVFRAQDVRLGRFVTVKFVPPEAGKSPAALERFHREARAVSALSHPNICALFDVGEHHGRPYIVMEFLEGRTVEQVIGARPVATETLLEVAIQAADALAAAHGKGYPASTSNRPICSSRKRDTSRSRLRIGETDRRRSRDIRVECSHA
jgi:serine/threonine protein kinase